MRRVTDFRVDKASIPLSEWDKLPPQVRELVKAYGSDFERTDKALTFEIAIYRWEEIDTLIQAAKNSDGKE